MGTGTPAAIRSPTPPASLIGAGRAAACGLLVLPLLFVLAGVHAIGAGVLSWLTTWGTAIGFGGGAILCALRARMIGAERRVWTWFAVACALWMLANLYYAVFVYPAAIPLPSPADVGYFSFPWAICAGILAYTATRLRHVPVDALIDALIASLAIASAAAALMFAAVQVDTHNTGAILTTVVYPAQDVLVLGFFAGTASIFGWQWNRRGMLIGLAMVGIAVGDAITFSRVLGGEDIGGAWANLGWSTGVALIALAAWVDILDRPALRQPHEDLQTALPVMFACLALVVILVVSVLDLDGIAAALAIAAVTVALVRLLRALRESRELADHRRLALTDELTGLPNRRRLLADLVVACGQTDSRSLALFDLDGFKHYNDTHGHSAGDDLLGSLAAELRACLPSTATAYRLGGDEFCVLADASGAGEVIARAVAALQADGPGWDVTASVGVVALPDEAADAMAALSTADQRMYAEKNRRPAAARQQARAVLLSALAEQQPQLREHVDDVTVLAAEVARTLGMEPSEVDDVVRAAELHDIGKLAMPREILDKPAALTEAEMRIMRRHTLVGERMLAAAPSLESTAVLVRSSHERWDGGGYPDGLAGEQIPLGARIVAVCDAFDAMIADRPYRSGCPAAEAMAELARCAGSQFDPEVVGAFIAAASQIPEHSHAPSARP